MAGIYSGSLIRLLTVGFETPENLEGLNTISQVSNVALLYAT
jgi:hypothetical protein